MTKTERKKKPARRITPLQVRLAALSTPPARTEDLAFSLNDSFTDSSAQDLLDALPGRNVKIDRNGTIVAMNRAWSQLGARATSQQTSFRIGANYLEICRHALVNGDPTAVESLAGIIAVLEGRRSWFRMKYLLVGQTQEVRQLIALGLRGGLDGAVVLHLDLADENHEETERLKNEGFFRSLIESTNLGYLITEPGGRVLEANREYLRLTGRASLVELVDHPLTDWTVQEDQGRILRAIDHCIKTGRPQRVEVHHLRPDGITSCIAMNLILNGPARRKRVLAFCLDVTEQKRSALSLQADQRARSSTSGQTELICHYRPDTTISYVNETYCRCFGRARGQLIGRSFLEQIPESSREITRQAVSKILRERQPLVTEHEFVTGDGVVRWQQWIDLPIFNRRGRIVELKRIGRDITERRQAEDALVRSHAHVRELLDRLIRAREEERRTIARELHDDLGQRIASYAITLSHLKQKPPADPAILKNRLSVLETEAMGLGDAIRSLSHQLHPAALEHLGLPSALRTLCADMTRHHRDLHLFAEADEIPEKISPDASLALYRIAQETVLNITRHARASIARIRLKRGDGELTLTIEDNGVGFDVEKTREAKQGLGLISIEERVRCLSGKLSISSRPTQGTVVAVTIPLRK
jgi:PAS domain S-box-containing protein